VLDRIGDKWSTLVVLMLGKHGKLRFNELSQAIGDVSQKMLTVTLRSLEADGLVSRKMYAEIPPRVEYELTEMGSGLLPLIRALEGWAGDNIEDIRRSRQRYDRKGAAA
jgi:DNA-binding HxlR family transcriptional regulator